MRMSKVFFTSMFMGLMSLPALAGWQYSGVYMGDGWYQENGSRFVLSLRGGAAIGMAKIENKVGAVVVPYMISPDGTDVSTLTYCEATGNCSGWINAGNGNYADLKADKDLETFSFAAGFSAGLTVPNKPQWRIEAGWDHIVKSDYNASPMFKGDLALVGGSWSEQVVVLAEVGSVNSHLTTDVFSIMAFYDFFDGLQKPVGQFIPYIGAGIGYADTKTVLNLSDPYGDIAYQLDLQQYGEVVENGGIYSIEFYQSERNTTNVAGLLAAGASYGITEKIFLDFGARLMYLPRVKWGLQNKDNTKQREFFSAENLIYLNLMAGVRFEF